MIGKWFKIIVFQCLQKKSGIRNDCILWERGFCVQRDSSGK